MKNFIKNKHTPSLLGVDIAGDAVKLVEMVKIKKSFLIKSYIKIPYIDQRHLLEIPREFIIEALNQALDEIKPSTKKAVIALPDVSVIIKTDLLDATLTEDEIVIRAYEQASKCFNISANKLALDVELLKQVGETKRYVRWVATKEKEIIDKASILKAVGLKVEIVDIYSFSLQRICLLIAKKLGFADQVVAIVHFDKESLLLVVLKGIDIIYTTTEFHQTSLHISDDENYFHNNNTNTLVRAIKVFFSSLPGENLSSIFLSGSFFYFEHIQENIKIPIVCFDIFSIFPCVDMSYRSKQYSAYEFMLSLGLALRVCDEC